jgi:hypothetical protein
VALDCRNVDRGRQIVDHPVQKLLHALVLEGGAAEDRRHRVGDGRGTDGVPQLLVGDVVAFQIALHQVIVVLHRCFDQLRP